ncbi:MAG: ABC transporter ATP-binding protein [Planctomycetales bacterium]
MSRSQSTSEAPVPAPASQSAAIECRGVIRDFGDGDTRTRVLQGIDLDVAAGEITLLTGPSGCGKTTLISIICGLLEPTAGEIRLFGVDRCALSGAELVRFRAKSIGFVFQHYNLLPALTAAENTAVPLMIAGMRRQRAVELARHALAAVEVGHRADALPSQLSAGQQQRVAIARALIHEPRLLVCDEPTAALDTHSGQTVMELVCHVALQPERAVLIVTHDHRVLRHGDRIAHMSDGRIVNVEQRARRGAAAGPSPVEAGP